MEKASENVEEKARFWQKFKGRRKKSKKCAVEDAVGCPRGLRLKKKKKTKLAVPFDPLIMLEPGPEQSGGCSGVMHSDLMGLETQVNESSDVLRVVPGLEQQAALEHVVVAVDGTAAVVFPVAAATEELNKQKSGPETELAPSKKLSFREGLSISLNYCIGFSVLLFPYQLARLGWSGFFVFFAALVVTWSTAMFIAEVMSTYPEIRSYADMGLKAATCIWGVDARRAQSITLMFFRVFQLLELFMYLIFGILAIEGSLYKLLGSTTHATVSLLTVLCILPMVFTTLTPRVLSRAGALGSLAFLGLWLLLLSTGIRANVESALAGKEDLSWGGLGFGSASFKDFSGGYGSTLLLFCGHAVFPSIFCELEDPKDMKRVVNWTYVLIALFVCPMSAILVIGYGKDEITDLPTGYLPSGTAENTVGQVLMIVKSCLSYGPILYPISCELENTGLFSYLTARFCCSTESQENQVSPTGASWTKRCVSGLLISAFAFFFGHTMPSLSFIVSLTGAIFAVSLALTFPAISFAAAMPASEYVFQRHYAKAIMVAGIASTCVSLYAVFAGAASH